MNDTIESILGILGDGTPELQIAAAQILGELRPKDAPVVQALAARVETEDYLARHTVAALGAIGNAAAIRELVAILGRAGPAVHVAALQLAEIGKPAVEPLSAAFDDAGPEVQMRILGILGRLPGAKALGVCEQALLDPELAVRAGEAIVGFQLERLDARSASALKKRLEKALGGDDLAPLTVATILGVLGRLDGMGNRTLLVRYAEPEQPAVVRQAALTALADVRLTPTQARALLDYLDDIDAVHVVEPAVAALRPVDKWSDDAVPRLKKLASSRRDALRAFAIGAMRFVPSKDLVKTLTQHLLGEDLELSEAAALALSNNVHARETLFRALFTERQLDRARRIAQPLRELAAGLDAAQTKSMVEKAVKHLLAQEPIGEIALETLLQAQPERVAVLVAEKAQRLRRAKKLHEAVALLAFLARAEHLDAAGQYQLAVVRLLIDQSEGRGDGEVGDATMGYLAALVRGEFPMFDRLRKEHTLTPETLLRVGQHFSEGVGPERRFGAELLHFLAEKHGRARAGEEARLALRAEGL